MPIRGTFLLFVLLFATAAPAMAQQPLRLLEVTGQELILADQRRLEADIFILWRESTPPGPLADDPPRLHDRLEQAVIQAARMTFADVTQSATAGDGLALVADSLLAKARETATGSGVEIVAGGISRLVPPPAVAAATVDAAIAEQLHEATTTGGVLLQRAGALDEELARRTDPREQASLRGKLAAARAGVIAWEAWAEDWAAYAVFREGISARDAAAGQSPDAAIAACVARLSPEPAAAPGPVLLPGAIRVEARTRESVTVALQLSATWTAAGQELAAGAADRIAALALAAAATAALPTIGVRDLRPAATDPLADLMADAQRLLDLGGTGIRLTTAGVAEVVFPPPLEAAFARTAAGWDTHRLLMAAVDDAGPATAAEAAALVSRAQAEADAFRRWLDAYRGDAAAAVRLLCRKSSGEGAG